MEYRSIAELNQCVVDWIPSLPRDLDVIAGIPRSGLMVANLLALHLNLPMTDVDGLIAGRALRTGQRLGGRGVGVLDEPRTVLVVDDSICSGSALREVQAKLRNAGLKHRLHYGVAFAAPEAVERGDIELYAEVVPLPRVFEWNVLHTPLLRNFCVDIDGVLCRDPADDENDDGPRYRGFLESADPLILPRYEIGWLVTSRLERYRADTERWLARHEVRYRELIMMDYPDMASRRAARAYASFKADVYRRTGASLFIESAPHTAAEIAELAQRPVFAMDTREMLYPGSMPRQRYVQVARKHPLRRFVERAQRAPRKVLRLLGLGNGASRPTANRDR